MAPTTNEIGEWTPFAGRHTCSAASCSCDVTSPESVADPFAPPPRPVELAFTNGWPWPAEFQA